LLVKYNRHCLCKDFLPHELSIEVWNSNLLCTQSQEKVVWPCETRQSLRGCSLDSNAALKFSHYLIFSHENVIKIYEISMKILISWAGTHEIEHYQ